MKRQILAAVAGLSVALVFTVAAVAAVTPGTYKGDLYQGAKKLAKSPVTIKVVGKKVTITTPRLPIACQAPDGSYTMASDPMKYIWKGTLKGNKISGIYVPPLGGTGEYFKAVGTFAPATKTFTGKLSWVSRCKGTSTAKAKKA